MTEVLVAGVGNIFAGDDAFGVEVAQRLARRPLPGGARVVDFGTRAIDLAYAIQDQCDALVLVDATCRGGAPGTLYVLEPQLAEPSDGSRELAAMHGLNPDAVLRQLGIAGTRCRRAVVVGCEPLAPPDDEDPSMGLSPPVAAAVERAVGVVESVIRQMLGADT